MAKFVDTVITTAQDFVKQAENLKDMTGPQRKAHVIKLMSDTINIPFVPEWAEGFIEPALYGLVIDSVCKVGNFVMNRFLGVMPNSDDDQSFTAKMVTAVKAEVAAVATGQPIDLTDVSARVGEALATNAAEAASARFDALLAKYGVKEG